MIKSVVLDQVSQAVQMESFWGEYWVKNVVPSPGSVSAHVGIFVEPFLTYILEGTKTIESRFSMNECDPYGVVKSGDVVLLKQAAGPVVGLCRVRTVWSYQVDPETLMDLKETFGEAMCANNSEFWVARADAAYATLMQIDNVSALAPFDIEKRDQRGWVVLKKRSRQKMLWED